MNKFLKGFLKVGLAVAKTQVPAIATVESEIKGLKTGKDKKKIVEEMVMASLNEIISENEIADMVLFMQGLNKINDGYVDIMNSLKKDD